MVNGQVGSIENNGASFGVGGWGGALAFKKTICSKI